MPYDRIKFKKYLSASLHITDNLSSVFKKTVVCLTLISNKFQYVLFSYTRGINMEPCVVSHSTKGGFPLHRVPCLVHQSNYSSIESKVRLILGATWFKCLVCQSFAGLSYTGILFSFYGIKMGFHCTLSFMLRVFNTSVT